MLSPAKWKVQPLAPSSERFAAINRFDDLRNAALTTVCFQCNNQKLLHVAGCCTLPAFTLVC